MMPAIPGTPPTRDRASSAANERRHRDVVVRAVAGVLMLCLVGGTTARLEAQERFYQAYDEGMKAFNAGDFATAERSFQRALKMDSRQSRQKRTYGMTFQVYIPGTYLGLIAVRQKQYQLAADYLSRIEKAGLVKKGDQEYPTLVAERLVAENGLRPATAVASAAPPPASSTTPPLPGQANTPPPGQANTPPPGQATTPPPAQATTPPPAQTTAATSKPSQPSPPASTQPSLTASAGTTTGAPPVEPLKTAPTPPAASATPPPIDPRTAAGTNVKDILSNIAGLLSARDYERAWDLAGRSTTPPPPAGFSQEQRGRIRTALTRDIRNQISRPNVAEASRLVETLSRLAPRDADLAGLQREVRDLRALLTAERETFSHLLKGDYTEAIRAGARLLDDKRESPRLLFYTACGHAGLALLGNDDSAAQSEKARELFLRTTLAAGAFQKEERYISPQILDVLRKPSR